MIKYRLRCAAAHEFEAWFPSSASYEAQADAKKVCCPECGSRDVGRAIMAPHVAAQGRMEQDTSAGERQSLFQALREVRKALIAKAEDVGERFPEEARKIHYGDAEPRRIHGTASCEEARQLQEEGVEVLAFPSLPEDAN